MAGVGCPACSLADGVVGLGDRGAKAVVRRLYEEWPLGEGGLRRLMFEWMVLSESSDFLFCCRLVVEASSSHQRQ